MYSIFGKNSLIEFWVTGKLRSVFGALGSLLGFQHMQNEWQKKEKKMSRYCIELFLKWRWWNQLELSNFVLILFYEHFKTKIREFILIGIEMISDILKGPS